MERAGQVDGKVAQTGRNKEIAQHKGKPRTALILYGSETGNAQDVAEEVGRMAERLRFDTTVLDLDSVQLRDLLKPTVIVFAVSTTGQGELPQNARKFWKTLLSGALKPGVLRRVRFSSFGIGDSSYARYNVAHRMLCGRMQQLGAQPFCERGEGNEQHPEGHSAGFREWIVQLKQKLLDSVPLPENVEPLADDEFLDPKWKLALVEDNEEKRSNGVPHDPHQPNGMSNGESPSSSQGHTKASNAMEDLPSREQVPVKDAHHARIVSNNRITTSDHFQDVRLLDIRLEDVIPYGPGAVAVVYPKNFPSDVQAFIDLMSWQNIADIPLTQQPTSPLSANTPPPLRNFSIPSSMTLRWLLENVLDIMSIPRRSFFANLIHFTDPAHPDSEYQKERLLELANPELIDELWDYTTRPKRTILEVMADFTTIRIPWQYCLSTLPLMKGRQFSIASGGHLRQSPDGPEKTRVQLLVAIADPPSPIIKYRRRYGVCTRYIATLAAGQQLRIGMQPGYLDAQPTDLEVPILMISPGTGLAPMRSLIWQRVMWAQEQALRAPGKALQGDVLLFGCRSKEADYFFRDEWEKLQQEESLIVLTAFSRDKDEPKRYVQDVIRANGEMVKRIVLREMGKIYLCGSSGNMPRGVRESLVDVLQETEGEDGEKMGREEAEAYLERMEREGRWKQETW
ncbi:NAPDH-dependent diflavin reductase [Saxophila tyrrhenica]|uniref:NADPH-dependent diflavin oxidoreductase 1 n=1 Tax=Saxophila tyrrhenica TaxID=1690608 RepID=A0AAV9PPT9_9PEZI|nr:NAPDH-dependent diflavin reductase [Saxophila tyrrhenica]